MSLPIPVAERHATFLAALHQLMRAHGVDEIAIDNPGYGKQIEVSYWGYWDGNGNPVREQGMVPMSYSIDVDLTK